jgi:hypothetical protein
MVLFVDVFWPLSYLAGLPNSNDHPGDCCIASIRTTKTNDQASAAA